MTEQENNQVKEMLKDFGMKKIDLAPILGLEKTSVTSMLSKAKPIPRWMVFGLWVYKTMKQRSNTIEISLEEYAALREAKGV
jgi:hypothetical protein